MSITITKQFLKDYKCCIIIPTYNNAKTLPRVLNGVLEYSQDVIVINDGATDKTPQILEAYNQLEVLTVSQNQGKGNALRLGFKKAIALGFNYAITIDSDGQHFPDDITNFMEHLRDSKNEEILLIGARNMTQEGVPKKSSFGNKFSNFWFWFETGIKMQDTQSGYRLYPLQPISRMKFVTKKFEFEIEVIVKAAWRGVKVENIPVQVLYDESERVSHFRPFKDFTRISILNTVFVIITLFYIKPRDFIRNFKKKGFKKFLAEDLLGIDDSPIKKAMSVALGIFIGISPLWGLHTILVVFLAVAFKLNKVIAFTFSNISLPPFIPFILIASLQVGNWIMGTEFNFSIDTIGENFEFVKHLKTYIIGSFSLALFTAILLGFFSFILFSFFGNKKVVANG